MKAGDIIKSLNLVPLPGEGGYFRETFKSAEMLIGSCLPQFYKQERSLTTCIYYMITRESFSAMHALPTEEIWHFYLGNPVEQLQLLPDGTGRKIRIGSNILEGHQPQVIVPAKAWQGTRLVEGGEFALFGTTMSPGFEFQDYTPAIKEDLIKQYPLFKNEISKYFHF